MTQEIKLKDIFSQEMLNVLDSWADCPIENANENCIILKTIELREKEHEKD